MFGVFAFDSFDKTQLTQAGTIKLWLTSLKESGPRLLRFAFSPLTLSVQGEKGYSLTRLKTQSFKLRAWSLFKALQPQLFAMSLL